MLDFTSSLFLGRSSVVLPGTSLPLTTGRPAALAEPVAAAQVAARVAEITGAAAGVVHRSTLHALIDAVRTTGRGGAVVMDAALYPLADTAVRVAVGDGLRIGRFAHQDAAAAARAVRRAAGPVTLVSDGWCTGCQQPAPLSRLARIARSCGGTLVVDDTQAVGVLGRHAPGAATFGDGGGTMQWLGVPGDDVLQVSSLAKAYGAPLAVTSGPARLIRALATAPLRWHASPPTAVDLATALAAVTDVAGAAWYRQRLYRLVSRLRTGLRRLGLSVVGRPFPVVSISGPGGRLERLRRTLFDAGIRALLVQPRCRRRPSLILLVTAAHRRDDIDSVLAVLDRSRRGWAA